MKLIVVEYHKEFYEVTVVVVVVVVGHVRVGQCTSTK